MKRLIVTGSAGFVGKHLVSALRARGDEVIAFDRNEPSMPIDLGDRRLRYLYYGEADMLVHLASSCSTLGSIRDPWQTFHDTVIPGVDATEYAREFGVPVIITSSVKARDGMTPYGAAKRMVEEWALESAATHHTRVTINRPGTIYGPGQEGSLESGWIAWFLRARAEDRTVTVNGDGRQVRDLLHVSDYVSLLLDQVDHFEAYEGTIWDVGGGQQNAVTVLEMVKYLGLNYELGPERYGDAREYVGMNLTRRWYPKVFWRDAEVFQ